MSHWNFLALEIGSIRLVLKINVARFTCNLKHDFLKMIFKHCGNGQTLQRPRHSLDFSINKYVRGPFLSRTKEPLMIEVSFLKPSASYNRESTVLNTT